ncbi:Fimbrillin-like protein [Bacteroides ovatus CL03T12C18]|uniref:fimbrillin family protein n=1 Tax=Bacteroides ovatus TaxID=28116 RepID=UPI00026915CC|nr:fimbrillin family protein [Bacteroides ovatus]EIY66571.1 hypothetical protein HMPREF1070_02171 [Bacteroides ovatus CL03T12C18]MBT0713173.1 Fimbrillin-like protein [Bacteroides ovatus CL03T12C18]TDA83873.1 hypothetical protein E1J05_00460 [Phocaeicola dorei]TDA91360.1 hypothetical protein E1J02_04800 [Phocaeicola dorei]
MKRSILRHKFALWVIAALTLASCSQDELAEQGTSLPDGMYPMTFTAVQAMPESTPQTRVSESANGVNSKWDGGEVIKVTVSGTGNDMETDCTLDGSGNITDYNPQLYWQNTNDATVNAWYSNIAGHSTVTENTVSLADQSSGLAYVLKTEETKAKYTDQYIELKFSHQLAKIRMKLEKGSYQGDLNNVTVKVKGYTSCTVKNGEVSEGSGEDYITMHKNGDWYEANLVPGTLKASEAFDINADGKNTKANLQNEILLEKGNVYEITINVESKYILINGDGTYTVDENKPVIIRGNVTVNFKNYKVNECYEGATIKIESGSPTLIFEGTDNSIECSEAPILLAPGASVTVKGSTGSAGDSQLTVRSGSNYPGIGSGYVGKDETTPEPCGDITIENITLYAYGSVQSTNTSAAIGTAGKNAGSCGDITITNSIVHAQGGPGAAAIGTGGNVYSNITCGKIMINHSEIYATIEYAYWMDSYQGYGAGIGLGALFNNRTATVGGISITTNETQDAFFSSDRFKNTDGNSTGFYMVGKSTYTDLGTQVWSGVTFNSKPLATGNDDGYPSLSSASEKLR